MLTKPGLDRLFGRDPVMGAYSWFNNNFIVYAEILGMQTCIGQYVVRKTVLPLCVCPEQVEAAGNVCSGNKPVITVIQYTVEVINLKKMQWKPVQQYIRH